MSLLSHESWVGATLKLLIIKKCLTQVGVSEIARIPKNRMSDIINSKGTPPKPDEIVRICQALGDYRPLGYRYCSTCCALGSYLGYQFDDLNTDNTGLSIISSLFGLEQMLGELAGMLCNNTLTPEMMARLSQIKLSIMTLEVMYNEGTLQASSADMMFLTEYLQKEKTAQKRAANKKSTV